MTQTAFSIGQRIYAALIRAANENPEGIAVRKNFSGGSRYGVDVGFPDWYREEPEKFASHPDDRGVLCMQIYVMPEDVGMEIKVRCHGDCLIHIRPIPTYKSIRRWKIRYPTTKAFIADINTEPAITSFIIRANG